MTRHCSDTTFTSLAQPVLNAAAPISENTSGSRMALLLSGWGREAIKCATAICASWAWPDPFAVAVTNASHRKTVSLLRKSFQLNDARGHLPRIRQTAFMTHKASTKPVAKAPVPAPALQLLLPSPFLAELTSAGSLLTGINKGHSNPIATFFCESICSDIVFANFSMLLPDKLLPSGSDAAQPNLFCLIEPTSAQNTARLFTVFHALFIQR